MGERTRKSSFLPFFFGMRIYQSIQKIHKFQFLGSGGGGSIVRGSGLQRVKATFLVFLGRKNIPEGTGSSRCLWSSGYPCPEEPLCSLWAHPVPGPAQPGAQSDLEWVKHPDFISQCPHRARSTWKGLQRDSPACSWSGQCSDTPNPTAVHEQLSMKNGQHQQLLLTNGTGPGFPVEIPRRGKSRAPLLPFAPELRGHWVSCREVGNRNQWWGDVGSERGGTQGSSGARWDTDGETRDFRWVNGLLMEELGIPGGFAVILMEKLRISVGFARILTEELRILHWAWNCGDIYRKLTGKSPSGHTFPLWEANRIPENPPQGTQFVQVWDQPLFRLLTGLLPLEQPGND